ncbi:Lacal_2735 family protein [Robiginitalea sp.]|uniref:Lacal_2735 family protein n=1 Tax=Robiginitalea sp. TaxID=1902411 RepID=UPI003C769863
MFGLFKKKSQTEKLQDEYKKIMSEAHKLSQVNRSAGDAKYAEAQDILNKIEAIEGGL